MIGSFLRHYFEVPEKVVKVVCLGGGVGTAQVLKGLRSRKNFDLTAVVSMADDGGSAGRLRRAFSVPPPGDIVNCLAALSEEESVLKDLFVYRFAGERYGKDTDIRGQKLGNLIFVALTDIYKGDINKALVEFSKIVSSKGRVLPATVGDVNIWALTKSDKKIYGEKNIDLGKYNDGNSLEEVFLDPKDAKAYPPTIKAINEADLIIVGPGDLFSTVLPVIIVQQVKIALLKSTAKKIFIVNIANKPFETPNYKVSDFIQALKKHLSKDVFDLYLVNENRAPIIPKKLKYKYVEHDATKVKTAHKVLLGDFVNADFPLYHDSDKIAKAVVRNLR
ncbi:YvcK family protein [Candidatus Curtissbacteria bacterium]|nr:YvcK family protein [Candidatus Curtissbacteria bacterium]